MCLNEQNIFYKKSISIKLLWLEIIEKIGCSKSVRPSTVVYYIYITRTDFEHHFSQLFRIRVVLSRCTFYKKCFFCWGTKKMLLIQNWWTIPLNIQFILMRIYFPLIQLLIKIYQVSKTIWRKIVIVIYETLWSAKK